MYSKSDEQVWNAYIFGFEFKTLDKLTSFIRPKSTLNLWRSSLWCFARLRNSSFSFFHGRRYSKSWICKNKCQRLHRNVLNRFKTIKVSAMYRQNLLNTYNYDNWGPFYHLVPFYPISSIRVPHCSVEKRYVWYRKLGNQYTKVRRSVLKFLTATCQDISL